MSTNGYRPESLAEALEILTTEAAIPIAGGTDLMVRHRRGGPLPIRLGSTPVFVGHLEELRAISTTESELHIGAAVTLSEIGSHPAVPDGLAAAIREFASPAIRNAGTIAGNICNASPAGDTLPYLYAAGASVVITSGSGERVIPIAEFISGPGQTILDKTELVSAVTIPRHSPAFHYYRKVAPRRSNALSKLSVYAEADKSGGGRTPVISSFRLAIGAVAPTVVRDLPAEQLLERATSEELHQRSEQILASYRAHIKPIDDQRSTAIYRQNTALTLIRHLIETELPQFLEQS